MRLLLDSHSFLWWLADDSRLKDTARREISNPESLVFVSAATIWEITIKAALGRLESGDTDLVEEIAENGFVESPCAKTRPPEIVHQISSLAEVSLTTFWSFLVEFPPLSLRWQLRQKIWLLAPCLHAGRRELTMGLPWP